MKILAEQTFHLRNKDQRDKTIKFSRYAAKVELLILEHKTDGDAQLIRFNEEEIKDLKNILENTNYIFNQDKYGDNKTNRDNYPGCQGM
jgi:K+/H+ antiporter YhaU regulatory subunit KhtT